MERSDVSSSSHILNQPSVLPTQKLLWQLPSPRMEYILYYFCPMTYLIWPYIDGTVRYIYCSTSSQEVNKMATWQRCWPPPDASFISVRTGQISMSFGTVGSTPTARRGPEHMWTCLELVGNIRLILHPISVIISVCVLSPPIIEQALCSWFSPLPEWRNHIKLRLHWRQVHYRDI
jgi:hypothetical protein